jgi:pyruvate dehydrogenase E2 component (dihydrolipoamide acetyltransferase)
VNLAVVTGSGPNGRIVRRDVEAAVGSGTDRQAIESVQQPTAAAPPRPHGSSTGPVGGTLVAMSRMRETIARRMQESVTQAPHFYVSNSINMREALKLREALKGLPEYKGISVNHLVMKAVGYGLAREPRVNCSVRDGQIFTPDQINIGIITAVEDGLLIPVVREVDKSSMKDVVFEARAAVERARAGRPNSSDLSGGTFSISNMGMFDVENFTAIINPGQGAILAVSAVKEQAIVEYGQITAAPIMRVTLSVDHRIIDGVMGSTFLKHFKDALETPGLLLA